MQRPLNKLSHSRLDLSEFYELKDTNFKPPAPVQQPNKPPTFKIPSSSDIIEEDIPPPRPKSPPTNFSFQKFTPPPKEDNVLSNPRNIHCVVIADHIMDCPICSRFYRNYTPIYNIIILILGIALVVLIIKCNNNKQFMNYIKSSSSGPPTI